MAVGFCRLALVMNGLSVLTTDASMSGLVPSTSPPCAP